MTTLVMAVAGPLRENQAIADSRRSMVSSDRPRPSGTPAQDAGEWFSTLADARRTTLPKRLGAPGPDEAARLAILHAAAAAPDHRRLLPWRFIEVPAALRPALADAFERALRERDPAASEAEASRAREKAHRAPWLMLVVARTGGGDPAVPAHERLVSAGCAIQNVLLAATARGFGSSLTSGKATGSAAIRELFGLDDDELALCFLNVGTVTEDRPARVRPAVSDYWSVLQRPGPE